MSEEILRKFAMQVRNWGRWGPNDEVARRDSQNAVIYRDFLVSTDSCARELSDRV